MEQISVARRTARNARRRASTFVGSIVFHAALFLVVFSRAAGNLVSAGDAGGGPVGPVFGVTLVRLAAPTVVDAEAAVSPSGPLLLKLRATSRTDGLPVAATTRSSQFAALSERLTVAERPAASPAHRFPAERAQPQGAYVADPARLSDARSRKAQSGARTDGETHDSASTGDLWGAIEPCWQNLGFRGQVPVAIEVFINGAGGLGRPPKVVRSTSALLSEARLKSEANALAALAACMPKGDVRVRGATYRLEFPAAP